MTKSKLNNIQKEEIIKKYKQGYSSLKLSKEYGIAGSNILSFLKKNNIEIRSIGCYKKYKLNESVFNEINKSSAYWLGFLAADAGVYNNTIQLELSNKDRDQLEYFSEFIESEYQIKETRKNCSRIYLSSKTIVEKIKLYNITPNKSKTISTPNIPVEFLSHFYRGYFDGDGWITSRPFRNRSGELTKTNKRSFDFGFCSGSFSMLNEIKHWCEFVLQESCGEVRKTKTVYQFAIGGTNKPKKLGEIIYKDSTEKIRLNRKYQKWLYLNDNC